MLDNACLVCNVLERIMKCFQQLMRILRLLHPVGAIQWRAKSRFLNLEESLLKI